MAIPVIQTAFVVGEVSPSLFGHTDLARLRSGAATMRNMWPNYTGGAYSRAGTSFVGFSKQTGRNVPPRMIPFQFSIDQGLALEFGNFYMRVVSDGAFVTEPANALVAISQASPGVITIADFSLASATANNGAVTSSYKAGDSVTLAGGSFALPATLDVETTQLASVAPNAVGTFYAPGDTIALTGGVASVQPMLRVATTQLVAVAIAFRGGGGTPGAAVLTGTTGTGTKFQLNVTISAGGELATINSIAVAGDYSANPSNIAFEYLSGAGFPSYGLPAVSISMGVNSVSILNPGSFTVNAFGGTFTQASSSGSGSGATFQSALFGPGTLSVTQTGEYLTTPANPVAQGSTTGTGAGATFNASFVAGSFNDGDWVSLADIGGMTELNGETLVLGKLTANTFALFDVYGAPVDTTAFPTYTGGGNASRIYTLTTPYAEADLKYLKYTQSADVMSLCCVNQQTLVEYPPQDMSRLAADNWVFSAAVAQPTVAPPTTVSGAASASGSVDYEYVVTSVSPVDGSESVASPIGLVSGAVDISATAGTITLTWPAVSSVNQYNIYKATPGYTVAPPVGALFGYAGSTFGNQFIDPNIVADFTQVPPVHNNPFARGQVVDATVLAGGASYTTITLTINSLTGSGASLEGVLVGGALSAIIVIDAGQNYSPQDTITVTGDGAGATASLDVGALSGTYPSVVAYFQQRRFYGNTLNNPDTYFASQPGAFTNFDSRIPTIDSDAITGTPWSVEVNGIQFFLSMPGGLVAFTGATVWQMGGSGGGALNPTPITPSSQSAQPQSSTGCSATVPPIRIQSDIIYVQAKDSNYLAANYQIYANNYITDYITLNSSHLFAGFNILEHAWCEEPYKLLWAIRSDFCLLSLTYLKPQEVIGWARHDTNGLFVSCCSITEKPTDVLYLATQRFPGNNTAYMIERMDERIWASVEETWCVDCGLSLPQPQPAANLTASSATGLGAVTGVTNLVGGENYSAATTAAVIDDDGGGSGAGAVPVLTIVGGVITAVSFAGNEGQNYSFPRIVISDPSNMGTGARADCVLDTSATFTADAAVFAAGDVGSVIRMGGGIAQVTAFTDAQHVTAQILSPIAATRPNSGGIVQSQASGTWTLTAPVTTISGLRHLAGATVTGLADGNVVPPTVVAADGTVTLAKAASQVTLGLGFQAQLQSVYLDAGEPTAQGQRKKIAAVTARIEASRGIKVGSNQVDGSTLSPQQIAPVWSNLADAPDKAVKPFNALATPLYTGDVRIPLDGGYATPGQVAAQQDNPLPMQILAFIPEDFPGDTPQLKAEPRRGQQQQAA